MIKRGGVTNNNNLLPKKNSHHLHRQQHLTTSAIPANLLGRRLPQCSSSSLWAFLCGCMVGGAIVSAAVVVVSAGGLVFAWPVAPNPFGGMTATGLTTFLWEDFPSKHDSDSKSDNCQISLGQYKGREARPNTNHDSPEAKGLAKCLVNTKFLKLSLHTNVKPPGVSNQIINDWVWIDYHDRVNILVQMTADNNENNNQGKFLVFEQTKYALEGRVSLAIVGGIVEPGEDPKDTAQREVQEELGQTCQTFHFLGRFVTDVNRGMGWLNSFLATGCTPITLKQRQEQELQLQLQDGNQENVQQDQIVGAADTEVQIVKQLSLAEVQKAFEQGRFLEAQWSATVGLALRHPSIQ
ncbi:hypothetical protein ACA910_007352 [Epithemia clementina (nom. ined.)]